MAGELVGVGYIRVDADTKPAALALKSLGSIGKTMLATTLLPVTQAVTAGVASLADSFVAAGAAGGAFAAAVIPQFKQIAGVSADYTKAQTAQKNAELASAHARALATDGGKAYKKALTEQATATESARKAQALYNADLNNLPPATRQTAVAFAGLKSDFQKWSDSLSGSTMPVFTLAITKLRNLLPSLTPLVQSAATVFHEFLTNFSSGTAGVVFQQFGSNIKKHAGGALHDLLYSIKNVVVGLAGIGNAFFPMSDKVSGGLEDLTAKFANWGAGLGQSPGFATFMKNVQTIVKEIGGKNGFGASLKDVAGAALKVGQNLGPLAGVSLKIATAFANIVAATPVPVLTGIATALIVGNLVTRTLQLFTAFKLLTGSTVASTAAQWLWNTAQGIGSRLALGTRLQLAALWTWQRIQTASTYIATAAQWAWNAAMDANPIGLVVLAIGALVAAVVVIATKTTWFQTLWKYTWGAIKDAFNATLNFITDHWRLLVSILGGPVGAAVVFILDHWKQIKNGFGDVISWIKSHWVAIVSIITGPVGTAVLYVVRHWDQIVDGAKAMLKSLTTWFSGLPGRVSSAVGKLGGTLYEKGKDLVSGLLGGAKAGLASVGKWASGIKDKIVGAVKNVFGIKSPSTVMAALGGHMMSGLLKGLLSGKAVLHNVVKGIFHSPLDAAKALVRNGINVTGFLGKNAGKLASELFGGFGSDASSHMSTNMTIGRNLMLSMGFQPSEWQALRTLWTNESGWRTNALNPSSGAFGIPQALPASKMASAGPDWRTNAATQIRWGLGYIKQRYGSPSWALAQWMNRSPHWYDNGGWLPTGLSLTMNGTGKPERIRTASQEAALNNGGPTIVVNVVNRGVIGNERQAIDFMVRALETIGRQGRIPRAFGGKNG